MVTRGGYYGYQPNGLRCSYRRANSPANNNYYIGFRLVWDPTETRITNSLGMVFTPIPSGTFEMGCEGEDSESGYSCNSDEAPIHTVTITKDLYMQTTEVTQGEWEAVMGTTPSSFSDCGNDCPVETVSWDDVQDFIDSLNDRREGSYRLPTEAEWEYACRAGTTTAWSFGDDEDQLGDYAWYDSNSDSQTHPVAQKEPNAWGLYDMHGNVYEWVQDTYSDSAYSSHAAEDPIYEGSGLAPVARSAGWYSSSLEGLRCARRFFHSPSGGGYGLGIRLVMIP
ncbi:MAG: formylglycine-generating enzyme family protein [Magnetococcales bacterium]|nr:formylglycine-generating enzyme family protein [Magnetococcales bacterium]